MTTEWIIYIILIVAALTVGSGLCNLFYYTCYGHPWEVFLLDPLCLMCDLVALSIDIQ